MEVCEVLAETGISQQLALFGAVAVLLFAAIFSRWPVQKYVLVFVVLLALVSTQPLHAQATPEDCPPSTSENPGTPSPGEEFALVADSFTAFSETPLLFSLLINDQQLSNDLIDWQTIDLDPDTPGQQTDIVFTHPENDAAICGSVSLEVAGVIGVYLSGECFVEDDETTLPLPAQFSPFYYTAQTLSGIPAPMPAPVIIAVQGGMPEWVVAAEGDGASLEVGQTTIQIQLLDNDSSSIGTLDPLSIDLDLATPGIQKTFTLTDEYGTLYASVDATGSLTLDYAEYAIGNDGKTFAFYTVKNTNGDTSNIASIAIYGR